MDYIGNILSNEKVEASSFFNITDDASKIIPTRPTLIVGWPLAKGLYPEARIINWKIKDNVYWTYGKRVRREKNEEDIKRFKDDTLKDALDKIDYKFINVLTLKKDNKVGLIKYLRSNRETYTLISDNMVYIYDVKSNNSIGISLSDIEYGGKDKKGILRNIFTKQNNIMVNERDVINSEIRTVIQNKRYIIPYLYYLNH